MPALTQTPYMDGKLFASNLAGKRARYCLANNTGSLTQTSSVADLDAAQISGNGYAPVEWTIPSGSYDATSGRFQAPVQTVTFQASSSGPLTWNFAYIVLGTINAGVTTWETTAASYFYSYSDALSPGEPRTFEVRLFTDGFQVSV